MSPNLKVYGRNQGGVTRWYGDFRAFADVGGGREALAVPGETLATTDHEEAIRLALGRLDELRALRLGQPVPAALVPVTLGAYAKHHLDAMRATDRVGEGRIATSTLYLERAAEFFGADRTVSSLRVRDVRSWASNLATRTGGRHGEASRLSPGTVRHHLNVLSKLFRRAMEEEIVTMNPVGAMMDKPTRAQREARYLEVHEGALLLEAAKRLPALPNNPAALPAVFASAFLGTFLLTGGRLSEVLGLERDDVSFDRKTVTFRLNKWRRLKTETSIRVVPLWPQLEAILRAFEAEWRDSRVGRLLFPSFETGREGLLKDSRKLLDRAAKLAGWKAGEIRTKMFRHTYCAARLQTLDQGAPVSLYAVSRELGHGSEDLVRRTYAHLGQIRHRSEVVEYRAEQHVAKLQDTFHALGFGTILTLPKSEPAENEKAPDHANDQGRWSSDSWARRDSNARPLAPEASALSS